MDMNFIKYPKGSVWWLDSSCLPIGDHLQRKNRPVVVVSGDQRGQSEIVEVCTITSVNKLHVCEGVNVPFRNGYGTLNYIQVNQHFTVDVSYLHDYQGQLSTTIIERLNSSLRFAQDLGDVDDLSKAVMELKHKLSSLQKLDCDKRAIETSMSYLHTMLKEITTYVETADRGLSEIRHQSSDDRSKDTDTTRRYIKFTEDTMLQYLVDMDSVNSGDISESDFLIKWNIRDMKCAKKKVNYINNKLAKKAEVTS